MGLLRDLQTLVARVGGLGATGGVGGGGGGGGGGGAQDSSSWPYFGEALCVAGFGPVLTWLLVRGHRLGTGSGDRHVWRALLKQVGSDEARGGGRGTPPYEIYEP